MILLFSVLLLFSTFRTQVGTLQTQVEALKSEQEGGRQHSFENQYFQMIRLHRNNVAEVELHGAKRRATGRKVFVLLLEEFRLILTLVRQLAENGKFNVDQSQLLRAAYYALFFGTGFNSSRMLVS